MSPTPQTPPTDRPLTAGEPLWMVHVLGPDEIYPAPDHATAVQWCAGMNGAIPGSDVLCVAVPALWTGSSKDHAAGLKEARDDFSALSRPATSAASEGMAKAKGGQWDAHTGEDYAVVMLPNETTDTASIQVYSDDEALPPDSGQREVMVHSGLKASIPTVDDASSPLQFLPTGPWKCFHCDDTFTAWHCARDHFGHDMDATPACQIKAGELGLVEALRRAEKDAADAWFAIHNESTEAAKAYHAQQTRHRDQMRAVEQAAYDRGIANVLANPESVGLMQIGGNLSAPAMGTERSGVNQA